MVVNAALNGIIAIAMWRSQPPVLRGMGWIAIGYLLLPMSFLIYLIDGFAGASAHLVTLRSVLTNGGLICIAEGVVVFLGHRRNLKIVVGLFLFAAISFELLHALAPDTLHYRAVLGQIAAILAFSRAIWGVTHSTGQKTARRLLLLTLYAGVMIGVVRGLFTAFHPDGPALAFSPQVQSWQFFQIVVVENVIFFSILVMIGSRLAEDLHVHSETLKRERQTNEALADALDRERHHRSEQGQFLGMLAHELGSPLAMIGRSAEMVMMGLGEAHADAVRRLDAIMTTVKRTSKLIGDLIASERTQMETSRFDVLNLAELVAVAIDNLNDANDAKRVVYVPASIDLPFKGDRVMLITALCNVIENALKYSPATTEVSVETYNDGKVHGVVVRDHGIGFPRDELAKIGTRFFRCSNVQGYNGTGLGMHIVSLILEKHGGRLTVENGPLDGAVVSVQIPAWTERGGA